jgi:hypothetical protein
VRYFHFCSHEQFPPDVLFREAVEAEQAGFDGVGCSDHLQPWWEPGESGHAWIWLGAAAQATREHGAQRAHDRPRGLRAMGDTARDPSRRDDTASEPVGEPDADRDGDGAEERGGPYGNPGSDEEALRKHQEDRSRERGRTPPPD